MNERKRVQLEGGGGRECRPRAALTRLVEPREPRAAPRRAPSRRARCGGGGHLARDEKTTLCGAAAPPAARGRAGAAAPLDAVERRGRGVAPGAAGHQSFDACRASGCRHVRRVSHEPPVGALWTLHERARARRRSRRARRSWSARLGSRAARACASRARSGATPSPSIRCWRRGRAISRCRRC